VLLIKAAISISLLGYLFSNINFPWYSLSIADNWYCWIAVVIVLWAIKISIHWFRWWRILGSLGCSPPRRLSLAWLTESMFFSQFFVTSAGGDISRVIRCRSYGIRTERAVMSVFLDRTFGLFSILLLCLLAIPQISLSFTYGRVLIILLLSGIIAIPVAIYVLHRMRLANAVFKHPALRWSGQFLFDFGFFMQQSKLVVLLLSTSITVHVLGCMTFWVVSRFLNIEMTLYQTLVGFPLVMLASFVPISIGGWGTREGAAIIVFSTFGISQQDALICSIGFGLTYLGVGFFGAIVWLALGRGCTHPQQITAVMDEET
jgi:hypothetical protein